MDELNGQLEKLALAAGCPLSRDVGINRLLPLIDYLRSKGHIVIVKWDGERESRQVTVLVSGGWLQGEVIRLDGDDPVATLSAALLQCLNAPHRA